MSKTFKALQRAAEERAKMSDRKRAEPDGNEKGYSDIPAPAGVPQAAEPRRNIPPSFAGEAVGPPSMEILERAERDRDEALRELHKVEALKEETARQAEKAREAARIAMDAQRIAAEREKSAREARRRAEREKAAGLAAKEAADRERRALEAIRSAVEVERAAAEKARCALLALKAELGSEAPPSDPALSADKRPADLALQNLLRSALLRSSDPHPVEVEVTGRVLGKIDPRRGAKLLSRYALLHCVREADDKTLWFWSNGKEARDYASRLGLLLDEKALGQ